MSIYYNQFCFNCKSLQEFVKNFAKDSTKFRHIQDFAMSVFALNEFYCVSNNNFQEHALEVGFLINSLIPVLSLNQSIGQRDLLAVYGAAVIPSVC